MQIPLAFWDISLWLGVTAMILLVTAELISPHFRKTDLCIDEKKLKRAAFTVAALFLVTVAIRIINVISAP